MSRQSSVPPRWNDNTTYHPGVVTWYSGCYWRCEKEHKSSLETSGAPTENPELWTQVATANPPQYQQLPAHPPAYDQASSGFGRLISSLPSIFNSSSTPPNHAQNQSPAMFEKQPHDMAPQDSTAFPSASDEKRSLASNVGFVSEKVTESLRYITAQKEAHSAKDHDELKDELKGKRHWRVGGVGIWAYNGEGADENMKRDTWTKWGEKHGKDEWIKAARARTEFYAQDSKGVKPLIQWKLVERGGRLPDDALPMGHEQNGTILYAARAYWEGGMHLGKAGSHLINSASISYGGREHTLDIYEVLCGSSDSNTLRWRNYAHGEKAAVEGWYPVEGGREKNGTPIFIAKGNYEAGEHPGKCLLNDDHACIGYGGGELWIRPFQVLAYCSPEHR